MIWEGMTWQSTQIQLYLIFTVLTVHSPKLEKTNKENVIGTENSKVSKTNGNYGKTIGNAKLSEEGVKYYQELKKKYSNMDFILVSKEQKANAQANAASYANGNKMVVLIDEEKIERMATDENYRKQYEGIIKNAASGLSQLKSQIESSGQSQNVVGYGNERLMMEEQHHFLQF